jgi:hypothetical protein
MSDTRLTPEVLELLEKVRTAFVEDRLPDAGEYMLQARVLIDACIPSTLPPSSPIIAVLIRGKRSL